MHNFNIATTVKDRQIVQDSSTSQTSNNNSDLSNASIDLSNDNYQNLENIDENLISEKRNKKKKKDKSLILCNRHRWTLKEKTIVLDVFGHFLQRDDHKLPTFNEIGNLLKAHLYVLGHRTVATLKTWLHNQKRKQTNNEMDKIQS